MSYTIFYERLFIDLGEGRFIPMAIMGDNNVWEWDDKRRARDWQCLSFRQSSYPIATTQDIILRYAKIKDDDISDKIKGRGFVPAKSFMRYLLNAAKQSITVEQLEEFYEGYGLTVNFCSYVKKEDKEKVEIPYEGRLRTTRDILRVIELWQEKGIEQYMRFDLNVQEDAVIWIRKQYFPRTRGEYKIVKKHGFYGLCASNARYFYKKTKYGYKYFSYSYPAKMKKFYSEKEAIQYITKYLLAEFVPKYIEYEHDVKIWVKGENDGK